MTKQSQQWLGKITIFLLAIMIPINAPASVVTEDISSNSYGGAWVPTDESVFAFEYDSENGQAYIYDFGAPENNLEISSGSSFSNIYFSEITNDGTSTWYADTIEGGQTLLLGENPEFGISFANESGTWFEYFLFGNSGAYTLIDPNTATALLIHDAETVHAPIPGAVLLLGTGLFSLAAVRTRYRGTT